MTKTETDKFKTQPAPDAVVAALDKVKNEIEYSSPQIRGKCYECGQVRGDFHVDCACPNCDGSDWMSTDSRFDPLAGVAAMLVNSGVSVPARRAKGGS